tara:strand:+ start:23548 stop:23925 length:378 start_codon:yes stop_codon:yes gene_type:complete
MSIQYTSDITALEKKAGQKAARTLSRRLKLVLGTATTKQSGLMLKGAGASAVMKFGVLDNITVRATSVTFKQHFGFEGIKKNGVRMKMKPFNHFDELFNGTKALDTLADEIGAIRAEQITRNIRF